MKHAVWISTTAAVLIAALAGLGGGYWYGKQTHSLNPAAASKGVATRSAAATQPGPVAQVRVAPIVHGTIHETLTAYGVVVAGVGQSDVFSVPFECRVQSVPVTNGQVVTAGMQLIDIEPSPAASLELENARAERDTAQSELQLAKRRFELKLNTRKDVVQAQQAADNAKARVKNLEERGINSVRSLSAKSPGVVMQVMAQKGQIVAAGAPLVETIGESHIDVRLGIESEDVGTLQTGQPVRLSSVNARNGKAISGEIHLVTRQVNPRTRLVDVFVKPAPDARLLLDQYVEGQIVVSSSTGLLVPRAAVLPHEGKYVLFTIEDGRAVKHVVTIGLENTQKVQVNGEGLRAGQSVVVVGTSQLEDGMAVRMEPAP